MCGFSYDTNEYDIKDFPPAPRTRLIVRPEGLIFFANKGPWLTSDLSEADIRDKSKTNDLANFLVCVQAPWFCIQCLIRLADLLRELPLIYWN